MINDNNNNTIEEGFISSEKIIRGQALYFSTSQVAEILGESDSKVRYYTKEFDLLFDKGDIEISNKQRRYTQKSIDKLKYFIELKNDGLTIKQIREYCEEVEWDEDRGIVVKESTPLHVQMIATAISEEQNKQMEIFKKDIGDKFLELMKFQVEENEKLRNQIALTVDEVVSEKLNEHLDNINTELAITKDINEKIDDLRTRMDKRKKVEEEKKGILGWFSKIKE